ncbi:hypothetical protein MMB17_20240 [Methylobacterium organophilum]|uniref:hypothetical protein n=1 Tax=Methylobacterium organophilum TaxID=410 RepID=UPI001F1357EB|nr:hypothetical protein [Methylobacterium organophilum]UMY16957.1 hypothetical protein MMB17_20240 [Methylobacterium organophilum]
MKRLILAASLASLCASLPGAAFALSTKECSTKYQAAKQAGTLNGQSWNDFRKAQCGDTAAAAPATTAPAPTTPAPTAPAPAAKPAAPTAAATPPAASGAALFPKAVDPKYAKDAPGKARQQTCLDQYKANKASGGTANGGMNWIQKGGGYFSECNKRLKV